MKIKVDVFYDEVTVPTKLEPLIVNVARRLFDLEKRKQCPTVNIIFTTDANVLELNNMHLGHNYYTDVLSFYYGAEAGAEIYISVERITENAELFNEEFKVELMRVVIHGLLHIAGYTDATEMDKKRMRTREDYYLDMFHVKQFDV